MKNDPLLLEIQDEISRENMVRFVNKYGKLLVAAGITLFIAIAVFQFWQQHHRQEASKAGSAIYAVMTNANKQDEFSLKKLDATAQSSGYYEISLLNKAQLQVNKNDFTAAITSYDAVAKNGSDKALRDLASINAANIFLNTNPHADGLEKRLTALTGDDNSFKYSARELLAAFYLANNNKPKAAEILAQLSKDPSVPVSISKRARELSIELSAEAATGNEKTPENEEE